jgi:phosphotriesterase-related protein
MNGMITTVLGPVTPEAMGITDAHNHLWISSQDGMAKKAPVLDKYDLILKELVDYKSSGGGSQVDCQPVGAGRDANRLRNLALSSGVNIVACTGYHLEAYYPAGFDLWQMNSENAAEFFLDEIVAGLMETRNVDQLVYPGFIKVAVREELDKTRLDMLEAAVVVSKQTGYTIEMHTERGEAVEDYLNFLNNMDFELDQLILCHMDKRPDIGLHKELAQAGCGLEYDTFFRQKYQPDQHVWKLIPKMISAGCHRSLVLATDLAESKLWRRIGGGPGLTGFTTHILKRLEEIIKDKRIILDLMGGNIAQFLAVDDKELHQ